MWKENNLKKQKKTQCWCNQRRNIHRQPMMCLHRGPSSNSAAVAGQVANLADMSQTWLGQFTFVFQFLFFIFGVDVWESLKGSLISNLYRETDFFSNPSKYWTKATTPAPLPLAPLACKKKRGQRQENHGWNSCNPKSSRRKLSELLGVLLLSSWKGSWILHFKSHPFPPHPVPAAGPFPFPLWQCLLRRHQFENDGQLNFALLGYNYKQHATSTPAPVLPVVDPNLNASHYWNQSLGLQLSYTVEKIQCYGIPHDWHLALLACVEATSASNC